MPSRFVLDTHTLAWIVVAPEKLGMAARKLAESVETGGGEAFVPDAVLEELVLLRECERVAVGLAAVREAFRLHPALLHLPGTMEQLAEFERLGTLSDPFDRRIVAAARSIGAKLVTRDRHIRDSGLVETLWD